MDSKIERFWNDIKGKKVAFCGIGVTNTPLIKLFAEKGAIVTACDMQSRADLGDICASLESLGVTLQLGERQLSNMSSFDVIFRSPGMRYDVPELCEAKAMGTVITSEMEVFFELCPCKTIGVTGSDGKTTTTTLISEMLKEQGYTVHLGGNIGRPLLPIIDQIGANDIAVVELSSFQLMSMHSSPDIAVVTNLAPNHLDIHKDLDEYIASKKNLLYHQNAFSKSILNLDNHTTRSMIDICKGQVLMFSRLEKVNNGAYFEDGSVYMSNFGKVTKIMERTDIKLVGDHNVENYLAAISAVWGMVTAETIKNVATDFGGVEHRMELVREINGTKWYNDSIATNPTRTIAGLNAYNEKIILIAGGYDKHIPYEPVAPAIVKKVKYLILMGATAKAINDVVVALPNYNPADMPIVFVDSMEEAVDKAKQFAKNGDIIALSPASASFDKYKNFEVRGNHFKDIVNSL